MAKELNLKGLIPAVVVPMREDYSIDFPAFERYLTWMVGLGPVGLALNVDTGEGPYLTPDERVEIIRTARKIAGGRCALIAGVGGPSTAAAVSNARAARDAGADALLVFPTAAFLNDPLDPDIPYAYHKAVADAAGLPIVVFQLGPIFGGLNYPEEALARVLELPQVIALKDASFDAQRFAATRDIVRRANHPITLLTGNDNFLLESFLLEADNARQFDTAVALAKNVQGFCDYIYGRPIGDYRARCKVALVHMGLFTPEQTYVRPPYQSLWDNEKDEARRAVERAGLLRIAN